MVEISFLSNIKGDLISNSSSSGFFFIATYKSVDRLYFYCIKTKEVSEEFRLNTNYIFKNLTLQFNRILIHYNSNNKDGILILDESSPKAYIEDITFKKTEQLKQFRLVKNLNSLLYNVIDKNLGVSKLCLINLETLLEKELYLHDGLISIQDSSANENFVAFILSEIGVCVNIGYIDISTKMVFVDKIYAMRVTKLLWKNNDGLYILTNEFDEFNSIYHISITDIQSNRVQYQLSPIYKLEYDIESVNKINDNLYLLKTNRLTKNEILLSDFKQINQLIKIPDAKVKHIAISNNGEHLLTFISTINTPLILKCFNLTTNSDETFIIQSVEEPSNISYNSEQLGSDIFFNIYYKNLKEVQPVLIYLHGGPHIQDTPEYNWLRNYIVNKNYSWVSLNYHGSSGFGKQFEECIYGNWGNHELKDIEELYSWLVKQTWVDKNNIIIAGDSYGGYLSLLAGSKLNLNFSKVISMSGPVNLVDFIINMPKETQNILVDIVGDIRNQKVLENLTANSPNQYIHNLIAPTFIAYGTQDSKINVKSVEDFISKGRDLDKRIVSVSFENEGHIFSDSKNIQYLLKALFTFIFT